MKKFKMLVRGRNFRFSFEEAGQSTIKLTGFYVWRAVEAPSLESAELAVMELLRAEPKLRTNRNAADDPPVMFLEEAHQLPADSDLSEINRAGFVFYHGRGAGRPRSMRVAARRLLPKAVRQVADRLWPSERKA
ncbi:MAG TPA: hypothetical protein VHB47_21800 [Thermoanaerobaculia bacterium]|jgi:hypothetical protein|nr:hypothetical protein [Thermoanaerobaculia bacterium]